MLLLVGLITLIYLLPANSNSPVLVELPEKPAARAVHDYLAAEKRPTSSPPTLPPQPKIPPDHEDTNQIAVPPDVVPLRFEGPTNDRQTAVVNAFKHAWKGYKEFAWGHDHLRPISGGYQDWFGLGLTIVDSLDTMYIMGLKNGNNNTRLFIINNK